MCVKCSKNVEEDSIKCESCLKWEHRVCAGISKEEHEILSGDLSTNIMFFCSICRPKVKLALKFFNDIEEKQKSLGERVKQLEEKLQSFVTKISQSSNHSSTLDFSSIDSQNNVNSDLQPETVTASLKTQKSPPKLSPSFLDKKFNIIVYGIEESSQGTKKYLRTQNDLNNLLAAFSNLKTTVDSNAIKDLFRLGKYKSDNCKPRPLLVKFLRVADVTSILKSKTQLKSPVYVKPDLPPEEQAKQSLLLKERWLLIQKGTDRRDIKLRNNSILVNDQSYCELKGRNLVFTQSSTTPCPVKPAQSVDQSLNQMDTNSDTTPETQS